MTGWIHSIFRIIVAICEHVVPNDSLPGTGKLVRVDESAGLGVVVAAVQVIQRALYVARVARRARTGAF